MGESWHSLIYPVPTAGSEAALDPRRATEAATKLPSSALIPCLVHT